MEREPQITTLSDREQDRLDRLLGSSRWFLYASFAGAGLAAIFQTVGPSSPRIPTLPTHLATVAVLGVALLAIIGDRLFRLAHPWLELDPRRPAGGWIVGNRDGGVWLRATLALLAPVALSAWAAALALDSILPQLTLVVAALLFAVSPRIIENHLDLLRERAVQPRSETRFSGWVTCVLGLGRNLAFGVALLLLLLATPPLWTYAVGDAAAVAILIFIGLWMSHFFVLLLHGPLDQIGARFGFATQSSLHPARQLIGKNVGDALDAYALAYDALSFFDKPRGKLLMVSFSARIDAEPVEIRLYLKYNAKRLFSVDRKWNADAVRTAEVASVECDYGKPATA